uniref:Uncharacterized protein n=1 Tax=Arundo donax TaxID=35708 RepID=A0A0A9FNR9_ARUDO
MTKGSSFTVSPITSHCQPWIYEA